MSFECTDDHIAQIARILGVEAKHYGNHYRFEIKGSEPQRNVSLEIYPRIAIGDQEGTLVSVFTPNSNLQLQHCSGVVTSELMGEVTFFAESGGKMSGLIVEREGGCSLYANVDRSLLSGDFTKLGPEVMLSGIALSLTELMLDDSDEEEPPVRPGD
ncbi:MAG: hypothetical protein JXA28_11445 [Bacteroidetes bacterium]|nr:hypothetical protein [Bacteroidota bacterium]